ncbi:hypothetical protein ACVI3S_006728 [Bradyrhizobium diazoefficiens]
MSLKPARLREGRTAAMTSKPGDRPRQYIGPRAGCLGGAPSSRRTRDFSCLRPPWPLSPTGVNAMSPLSLPVATLGTPRIGPRRELKLALESYWAGKISEQQLHEDAFGLRAANWARQKSLGVTIIPSNDFSLYDQVLDTSVMVGAIPEIYAANGESVSLANVLRHGPRIAMRRAGCELRPEPAGIWRARAGNDQVVRYQLPLHGS